MKLHSAVKQAIASRKGREVLFALVCFLSPMLLAPAMANVGNTLVWTQDPTFEGWGAVTRLCAVAAQKGTISYAVLSAHGIYRNSGIGNPWVPVIDGLPEGGLGQVRVRAFSVAPDEPLTVYVGLISVNPGRPSLYRSRDGGTSWTVLAGLTDRRVHALGVPVGQPSWVYAATEGQLYRSVDRGMTWEARGGWSGAAEVLCMAISPQDPDNVYLGTSGQGLLTTIDGGRSWGRGLPGTRVFALALGQREGVLYAGTDSGLYGTEDGGGTWQVRGDEWTGQRVYAVAVSPTDDGTLYLGIEDEGVYRSFDGGQEWIALKRGMGNATVRALAVDPGDPWLIRAGSGNGLWRCALYLPEGHPLAAP